MAQVVVTDQQGIAESTTMWARTIILGAITGLVFWLLAVIIGRYIIDPVACGNSFNAALCMDSAPLSGNIAAILAGVIGLISMVRIGTARPIIVAIASAALLWNLGTWVDGLSWTEAAVWSIALYAVAYALFAWITRYASLWAAISISFVIVLIVRITLVM